MRPRLIQERKAHKMTQEEAANFLGITTRHYQALEAGTSDGSVKIWGQLSHRFNVSINALLAQDADDSQPDYSNSRADGIEKARKLDTAARGFDLDVDAILDIVDNGRLDDPDKRGRFKRFIKALEAVIQDVA